MFDFFGHKKEIERLTKIAYYDALTGLPNRLMFQEHSAKLMERSTKTAEPFTVFLIDLDNFKHINDTHGHAVGDIVLKRAAARIDAVRQARCTITQSVYNDPGCICFAARLGGDEFVVLFEHMDKHEAEIVASQMISTLKEPVIIEGKEIIVSSSLGVSIFPWDASDISKLLKAADLAMYVAKADGKDGFAFHESYMNTKLERRVEAELLVRKIIDTGEISLAYQPIFFVDSQKLSGFEALLRGATGSTTTFTPPELIEVAEESNLIIPLGNIILEQAMRFTRECLDAGFDLTASVNVSSPQLVDEDFLDHLQKLFAETLLPPRNLRLEITETMLMSKFEQSAITMEKLKEFGVRMSIDDFGKGYSSFNYLQVLPINTIKIDMSFVQQLGADPKTNTIVQGMIMMAEAMGMETCAEGVENKYQLAKLLEFGCVRFQGHYKYPALPPTEFFQMLTHEKLAN